MSDGGDRPIAATDRVSDVLARDEALVEVFVRQAPQFAKLRNRSMRRIMARLVTVEQAARMAVVSPAALVRELNAALGIVTEPLDVAVPGALAGSPESIHPAQAPVLEVDVREDLRAGREPFSKIMAAVARLRGDEVLLLRAPFEPIPLYAVLGKRGLVHEARAESPNDWSVWFWRPSAVNPDARRPASAAAGGSPTGESEESEPGTVRLDVRGLEPPEPMVRTLAALEALPADHTLVQVNTRVPQFLLPVLAERGFVWEIDDTTAGRVIVRIRRSNSHERSAVMPVHAVELDVRPIPPREKHPTIFRTFDSLAAGQEMVIINDHDPRPLRYQFQAERPESFEWSYEEEGPEVWRVRISRR